MINDGYFIDWQLGMAIVIALVGSLSMMCYFFYLHTKMLSYVIELEDEIQRLRT